MIHAQPQKSILRHSVVVLNDHLGLIMGWNVIYGGGPQTRDHQDFSENGLRNEKPSEKLFSREMNVE